MRTYYQVLFSYATKFCRDGEFVKDCLQELFLELWKNRSSLGPTEYVKSYLFKSIRNKIFRELHKNRFHNDSASIDHDHDFYVEFSIEHHLIREQTMREVANTFAHLLNKLPKRQKEIVYLRFYQDMDATEISNIMDISSQSVYNLIYKALKFLRTSEEIQTYRKFRE